jgi:hypothetical protein
LGILPYSFATRSGAQSRKESHKMTRLPQAYRHFVLAACLAAPLFAVLPARADSTLACSALATGSAEGYGPGALQITKVEQLFHFQARPYVRIPDGVALSVRAPRGMTAADLHNLVGDCQKTARDDGSVLCVKGALISVERSGGSYVVRVTSTDRVTALEIQSRAARK